MVYSILITPVQTSAVSVYGALWEKKNPTQLFDCFHSLGLCTHPAFPLTWLSVEVCGYIALRSEPCSSNTLRVQRRSVRRGGPCRGGNKLLRSVLFRSAKQILGLTSTQILFPHEVIIPLQFTLCTDKLQSKLCLYLKKCLIQ